MNVGSTSGGGWPLSASALLVASLVRDDDDAGAAGFDAYIQSGTCAQPSDDYVVDVESEDTAYDVEPYVAVGEASRSPSVTTAPRASRLRSRCDLHRPAVLDGDLRPRHRRRRRLRRHPPARCRPVRGGGPAVVQLLPVGSSDVEGVAAIERATLERELDITPTRVRIILSTDPVSVPDEAAAGYEGYVQGGRCESPPGEVRVELKSQDEYDVTPFKAVSADTGDPVTVASYGSPGAPGFGLAAPTPIRTSRWSSRTPNRASRPRAATFSKRTPTSSWRPDRRSCRSCRPVTPGCRDTPSWIGWGCSVSSTSRPR